ncbi:unnamed protein product [Orchesella dallaii]|uniref:SET domain-containing protein n=1 Tax=Orchesella dallaii TaxID=48710 RepID=A0ABP1R8X5_9HEXA
MDINGARTLDIKRMKLSPTDEAKLESDNNAETVNFEEEEDDTNGKGDISLVYKALEDSPFELDGDSAYGLCLIAKRDLKAGELLHDDTPAFFGPSADLVEDYSTPLCLGCCVVMNDGNGENRCPTCGWPICSSDCDNIEHHKANECGLFVKHDVKFPPNVEIQPCYKAIAIIRGLLVKERSPQMWEQLMTLQWKTQLQLTPFPDFEEFKENFGLPEFGEEEDWTRILGIINVNSYSFQRIEKKEGSPSFGECLFPIYSLMCHSCSPNCTWAIQYSPEFSMKVRPTVDIKKGEMLSVCYNHEFSKFGFYKRQEKIRERAEFECKCRRCVDPHDLGTDLAAVKCFKCKEGLMLPEDASDFEMDWKCDKCSYGMSPEFISSFVESLYEQSDMAEDEAQETGEPVVKIFEDFILSNSNIKVHSNHWVIAEAAHAIVRLQASNLSKLKLEEVNRFTDLCQYLLQIKNVIAPGFSNERGMLHHHLARGYYMKVKLLINTDALKTTLSEEDLINIHNVQKYAMKFWKENPHYESLTENLKREPEYLIGEAEEIKLLLEGSNVPK